MTEYSDEIHLRLVEFHLRVAKPWFDYGFASMEQIQVSREILRAAIEGVPVSLQAIAEANHMSRETVRRRILEVSDICRPYGNPKARTDPEAQKAVVDFNRPYSDASVDALLECADDIRQMIDKMEQDAE